jgi:hypothetical protein
MTEAPLLFAGIHTKFKGSVPDRKDRPLRVVLHASQHSPLPPSRSVAIPRPARCVQ